MGTTARYGFRYPSLADPPNVPQAIQDLAIDVEQQLDEGGVVGRNQRTSLLTVPQAQAGNLVRVLSTSAEIRTGRSYRVTGQCEIYSDGAPCVAQAELRFTVGGGEPTITSTQMGRYVDRMDGIEIPTTFTPTALYTPTNGGTLSVLLCVRVFQETGDDYNVGGLPGYPASLVIEDVGVAQNSTGTIYTSL